MSDAPMFSERWEKAVANAKIVLEQYKNQPNKEDYSWTVWSIGNWLYLEQAWKRQGIVVLEALEAIVFDPIKSKNHTFKGPKRGKAGREIAD
jgi:hypothetical protein